MNFKVVHIDIKTSEDAHEELGIGLSTVTVIV